MRSYHNTQLIGLSWKVQDIETLTLTTFTGVCGLVTNKAYISLQGNYVFRWNLCHWF